jgi:peptidoglycan/xylan/chitin deacetylase (PgdA/CDA1 family)
VAALLLSAALILLSILVAAFSGGRPGDSLAAPTAGAATLASRGGDTVPAGATGGLRYRITGCVSRGEGAIRGGPPRREVAIGFDDGPWTDTPKFVTMLERAGVRASFFIIGRQVSSSSRGILLRELRDGDVLGDHTFSHPDLTRSPEVRSQLLRTIEAIRAQTGYTPCVFRPPYGAYDSSVLRRARSLGLATILWDVDPADWADPGTARIAGRVLAQVRPGSIIISHDGGGPRGQTLAAYPAIIRGLRRRGYRIVTPLELLGFHPVYEPCVRLCDGLGLKRSELPRGAIIARAP